MIFRHKLPPRCSVAKIIRIRNGVQEVLQQVIYKVYHCGYFMVDNDGFIYIRYSRKKDRFEITYRQPEFWKEIV